MVVVSRLLVGEQIRHTDVALAVQHSPTDLGSGACTHPVSIPVLSVTVELGTWIGAQVHDAHSVIAYRRSLSDSR